MEWDGGGEDKHPSGLGSSPPKLSKLAGSSASGHARKGETNKRRLDSLVTLKIGVPKDSEIVSGLHV